MLWNLFILVSLLAAVVVIGRYGVVPLYRRWRIRQSAAWCPGVTIPPLPTSQDKKVLVPSRRYSYRTYKVNLHRLRCSCRRYRSYHRFYPANDIRRICRHMLRALRDGDHLERYDELTQCLFQYRVPDRCYQEVELGGAPAALGFHPRSRYVRVYLRMNAPGDPEQGPFTGGYAKFVYNRRQEVWIYGIPPPHEKEEVVPAIQRLMAAHPLSPADDNRINRR